MKNRREEEERIEEKMKNRREEEMQNRREEERIGDEE